MHQKYLNLCSEDERRSYTFGTTRGWVINDRILIFGWTIPLDQHKDVGGISFNTKQLSAGIVLYWLLYSCNVCSITIQSRLKEYDCIMLNLLLKNEVWFTVHGLSKKFFKVTAPEIQQWVCHLKSDLAFTLQTLPTSWQPVDGCVCECSPLVNLPVRDVL